MEREYFAYGTVLEALSFGLYQNKRHVIREFVQNAFDAINEWRKISGEHTMSPIEIKIQRPSIFIADRGLGMDNKAAQTFRYIGYSAKNGIDTVGFRGIGKDSGLAVAERIIVTTSRYGIPKRYTIVINAKEMLDECASGDNPPLEEILKKHNTMTEEKEVQESHYTFVELNGIRKDAEVLFEIGELKNYISRNCPVPYNPGFEYSDEIVTRLEESVPLFSYVDIVLDGENIYKPFPKNYTRPEYVPIFLNDEDGAPLIAYCWYCGHQEKGQFPEKQDSGLIYRVKDFAVGDRHLTRETLWKATPERAFYFFGEIHILDKFVIPSSDRTNFEDNEARQRLYERCRRIAQVLNQKAGAESEQRRFDEAIKSTGSLVNLRKSELEGAEISVEVKPDIEFQIRKVREDVEKRLRRTEGRKIKTDKEKQQIQRANSVIQATDRLLEQIESSDLFVDVREVVELNEQAEQVYQIIVECLREELRYDVERLERIINKINEKLARIFESIPK